ncbi:MAG: aspartate/glutamate racemase family protein [Pseudomonadota bacterium]
MKRVLVIVPFPMNAENRAKRAAQIGAVELGPGIEFAFESVRAAPKNYVSASDMVLAEFGAFEAGLDAQRRGFDAVCIDTMSDSGLAALRAELSIPVIGPGRASVLMAMMLGHRFSIIAMWPHWQHLYRKVLTELGVERSCASVRWIESQPDNQGLLGDRSTDVFEALTEVAFKAVDEDGAEVVLLGSTTMHEAHGYMAERLPVPVINPGPLTYKLAEAVLGLGLTHSKRAYPASPAPQDALIHAMLDAADPASD